ncbi:Rad52/Rad22 family DNA repair protein [Anabaena cylindrica UHCC 0172]|uniref:Rad52/Rad22 family DNA repair protein n=1 Tax=Anabaena cylindrica TaxID=1165 RepID=UPI002B2007CE|nr:Rad52/Rad22 family DNA repair protein [Anabaena cylindrica]MEA5553310.1 Rad52/Rad22 family DNA repair protein [Anabaena cylindrica UHCC 0172]
MLTVTREEFKQILAELSKPFLPEQHQERTLRGGGRWLFVPWQHIRDRLNDVYPEWSCSYSHPIYVGDDCCIRCTITIAGVSREAPGIAPIVLLSNEGKNMARGTPTERAIADAFKNAAEAFGVAAYLDDQKLTDKLMRKQGDLRAYKFGKENDELAAGARGIPIKKSQPVKKVLPVTAAQVIDLEQVKLLWATARKLQLSEDDVKEAIAKFNLVSTKEIPANKFSQVMTELENLAF